MKDLEEQEVMSGDAALEEFEKEEQMFKISEAPPVTENDPKMETLKEETPKDQEKSEETTPEEADTESKEEEEEKDIDWEKRYKDAQSFGTKKAQEAAEKEKELQAHKKVLNRFDHRIKRDENGLPVDWDFGDESEQKAEKKEAPGKPTEDEWRDSPTEAGDKFEAYMDWKSDQKLNAREQQREEKYRQAEARSAGETLWNENLNKMAEEFKDLGDENSPLYKEVVSILNEKDPALKKMSSGITYAVERAARELGVTAVKKAQKKEVKAETKTKKERTYITDIKSGGSPGAKPDPSKDTELAKFEAEEAKFRTRGAGIF